LASRPNKSARIWIISTDKNNVGIHQSISTSIYNRLHIRSSTGNQDPNSQFFFHAQFSFSTHYYDIQHSPPYTQTEFSKNSSVVKEWKTKKPTLLSGPAFYFMPIP
jgi:hypothetical protein